MEEVIEGAHPRSKPRFGLPERESDGSKKQSRTEGQMGSGLVAGIKVEVPSDTAYYGSFNDIRGSGNPRPKGPQSFEEKGTELLPSQSSLDEHGQLKPIQIGGREYIEVIVGTKSTGGGIEVPDTRVIRYNDPLKVNRKRREKRVLSYT